MSAFTLSRTTLGLLLGGLILIQPLQAGDGQLIIADRGKTSAVVVVSPKAGTWEKRAAEDLVHFIGLMTGAKPALVHTEEAVAAALARADVPTFIVGSVALSADPDLPTVLNKVAKKEPVLRADAIVLRRKGNRVFLAGTNDDSHYYAVVEGGHVMWWKSRPYVEFSIRSHF